jgi:hypothetical protein
MPSRTVLKLTSSDGRHYVEFYCRKDGCFGYAGFSERFLDAAEEIAQERSNPDFGEEIEKALWRQDGEPYWLRTDSSGLFDTLATAQRDAVSQIHWLKVELPGLGQDIPPHFWQWLRGLLNY